jgi:hypothetical protein
MFWRRSIDDLCFPRKTISCTPMIPIIRAQKTHENKTVWSFVSRSVLWSQTGPPWKNKEQENIMWIPRKWNNVYWIFLTNSWRFREGQNNTSYQKCVKKNVFTQRTSTTVVYYGLQGRKVQVFLLFLVVIGERLDRICPDTYYRSGKSATVSLKNTNKPNIVVVYYKSKTRSKESI